MEEEKKQAPMSFADIEHQSEEKLNQFIFLIFVPNPTTKQVHVWIDGGDFETFMHVDKFLDIVQKTCGFKERCKIEVACSEYGTPYLYDRDKAHLEQLIELPPPRKMEFTPDYHKEFESKNKDPYGADGLFHSTQGSYDKLKNFGLPNMDRFSTSKR